MSSNGDILMGKVEESQASGAALSPTFNMVAIKGLGKSIFRKKKLFLLLF